MTTSLASRGEGAKPKFLEQVRTILRTRHYSLRTEEAYLGWIRRFIIFHGKRHPEGMARISFAHVPRASNRAVRCSMFTC